MLPFLCFLRLLHARIATKKSFYEIAVKSHHAVTFSPSLETMFPASARREAHQSVEGCIEGKNRVAHPENINIIPRG